MTGPLGVSAFRRLWIAGFVSEIGDWVLLVALPVYVYQRTGSAAATATTFVVALLPSLALSPLAGVLADRWDRRRLMLLVSLAQAATLLPLLTGDLVLVNVVTAVQAGLAALFEPAKNALLPTLVPREHLPSAISLNTIVTQSAAVIGPALTLLLDRRLPPIKLFFNLGQFALSVCLANLLCYWLAPVGTAVRVLP